MNLASTSLLAALKTHFGFDHFRPGQQAIVTDALASRDLLAIMPTGGGKSLCFWMQVCVWFWRFSYSSPSRHSHAQKAQ